MMNTEQKNIIAIVNAGLLSLLTLTKNQLVG